MKEKLQFKTNLKQVIVFNFSRRNANAVFRHVWGFPPNEMTKYIVLLCSLEQHVALTSVCLCHPKQNTSVSSCDSSMVVVWLCFGERISWFGKDHEYFMKFRGTFVVVVTIENIWSDCGCEETNITLSWLIHQPLQYVTWLPPLLPP